MEKIHIPIKQLLILILIVIAVFLLLDFQSRKNLLFQVENQRDLIYEEVVQLKQTEAALEEELQYANSPAMIDTFAREDMSGGLPVTCW